MLIFTDPQKLTKRYKSDSITIIVDSFTIVLRFGLDQNRVKRKKKELIFQHETLSLNALNGLCVFIPFAKFIIFWCLNLLYCVAMLQPFAITQDIFKMVSLYLLVLLCTLFALQCLVYGMPYLILYRWGFCFQALPFLKLF